MTERVTHFPRESVVRRAGDAVYATHLLRESVGKRLPDGERVWVTQLVREIICRRVIPPASEGLYTLAQTGVGW